MANDAEVIGQPVVHREQPIKSLREMFEIFVKGWTDCRGSHMRLLKCFDRRPDAVM